MQYECLTSWHKTAPVAEKSADEQTKKPANERTTEPTNDKGSDLPKPPLGVASL